MWSVIPENILGDLQCESYFHITVKMVFIFFTLLTFMPMTFTPKLLEPLHCIRAVASKWLWGFFFFFFLVLPLYCYQPISLHPRAHMLSHVTPWTAARQVPLSMDFSRQEYWSGLPFPSPCGFCFLCFFFSFLFCVGYS